MHTRDLLAFAAQALRGHHLRTGLSLLGVAVGVAAVIALTALGEGARRYVLDQFATLGTNLLAVLPGKAETTGALPGIGKPPHDLTLADAEALRRAVPEAHVVVPLSFGNETVSHGDLSRQVAVLGSTAELVTVFGIVMREGTYLPAGEMTRGAPVTVLGATVARELFPDRSAVGQIVRVGDWRMRVLGVIENRGTHLGFNFDEVVFVPVATAFRLFNRTSLARVLLKLDAHAEMETAKQKARVALLARHDGEDDVTLFTQDAVMGSLSGILTVLTLALGSIAAISLAVAGIGIMNVMLVSVSERTREVGLLKALGAGRRQVLGVFLAEAVLLSAAGGLCGLGAGYAAVGVLVHIFPSFPAAPPLWAVGAALALSLGVGAVFGVLPARQAMQLDPVTALGRK